MALDGIIETIQGRNGEEKELTDGSQDISSGVEREVADVTAFTIFIQAAGAVDVTVEFSPDGGTTWYEPKKESPVSFSGANTDLVHVDYNATNVRLTGSDATGVNAQIREVV